MSPPPPTNGVPGRPVALVASCTGWGSGLIGAERGPDLLLEAGLVQRLEADGVHVASVTRVQSDPSMKAGKLDPAARETVIFDAAERVADVVVGAREDGYFPVVIGGDHTSAIGLYLGLSRSAGAPIGSVWIDAHPDVNTPDTSPSGNLHGMVVAGLLGHGSAAMREATAGSTLSASAIAMLGVRAIDPGEAAFLESNDIRCIGMDMVKERGLSPCLRDAATHATAAGDGWGLTIDLDVIDPAHAPFVATQVPDGLDPDALFAALRTLPTRDRLLGLEVTEFTADEKCLSNDAAMLMARIVSAAIGQPS